MIPQLKIFVFFQAVVLNSCSLHYAIDKKLNFPTNGTEVDIIEYILNTTCDSMFTTVLYPNGLDTFSHSYSLHVINRQGLDSTVYYHSIQNVNPTITNYVSKIGSKYLVEDFSDRIGPIKRNHTQWTEEYDTNLNLLEICYIRPDYVGKQCSVYRYRNLGKGLYSCEDLENQSTVYYKFKHGNLCKVYSSNQEISVQLTYFKQNVTNISLRFYQSDVKYLISYEEDRMMSMNVFTEDKNTFYKFSYTPGLIQAVSEDSTIILKFYLTNGGKT